MPIKSPTWLLSLIISENGDEKSHCRRKYALICRKNKIHYSIVIDVPNGYYLNKELLENNGTGLVEYHKLTDEFDENRLGKRIKLLDRQLEKRITRQA